VSCGGPGVATGCAKATCPASDPQAAADRDGSANLARSRPAPWQPSYAPLRRVLEIVQRRCPVPVSVVGQHCAGVPSVVIDNRRGAARIVEHLVRDHGRTRLVYIAGPTGHEESDHRLLAAREALARYGLRLDPEAVAQLARAWQGDAVPEPVVVDTELVIRESCGCHPRPAGPGTTQQGAPGHAGPEPHARTRAPALHRHRCTQ
jgi:hypothetical protein